MTTAIRNSIQSHRFQITIGSSRLCRPRSFASSASPPRKSSISPLRCRGPFRAVDQAEARRPPLRDNHLSRLIRIRAKASF